MTLRPLDIVAMGTTDYDIMSSPPSAAGASHPSAVAPICWTPWSMTVRTGTASAASSRKCATAVDAGSAAAWRSATGFAAGRGLAMPATWLMAGYRRNNLTDTLDVRYYFDPALAGNPAVAANRGWSRAQIYGASTKSLVERAMFWRDKPDREPPASPAVRAEADA